MASLKRWQISYILFLCLYSVVILTQFEQNVLSPIDYILAIWIFTLVCEEIRQARSVSGKLLEYIGNYWNLFDLANITTFIVAFVLRFFPETFIVARVLYSLNLMIFSFRLLHIFYINKVMGPKLIMIARMSSYEFTGTLEQSRVCSRVWVALSHVKGDPPKACVGTGVLPPLPSSTSVWAGQARYAFLLQLRVRLSVDNDSLSAVLEVADDPPLHARAGVDVDDALQKMSMIHTIKCLTHLKDLLFFVFILIIFILAYGIASQSILYPNESRVETVLRGIFHKAYFQIYGELFLEEIMNDRFTCEANDSLAIATNQQRCPSEAGTYVVPVLLGLYMLVTNVLLLNLLIAMFGYTFEKVQENTDKIWKFQRYDLIKEYSDRPPLAPPIIIFSHLFLLFRAITMGCCKMCRPGDNVMKVKLKKAERKQLILWEYLNTENYLQQTQREKSQETGERVHDTQKKVEELKDLANEQDKRLTRLEEQMLKSTMSLAWIIKSLQQNNLSAKEAPPELELAPAGE
ncbi:Transient receptor putative cation channel sub M member 2 [Branchiostoma belcheri]|nr:Transient receptor putative cation channel sub M member 2 [Branchiostoma belcheri]